MTAPAMKRALRRQGLAKQGIALALMLPAVIFLFINFVVPIGLVLYRAVDDRAVSSVLVRTSDRIAEWDGEDLPDEAVYEALVADLREAQAAKTLHVAAKRLNADVSGYNRLMRSTERALRKIELTDFKSGLIEINEKWGETHYWRAIKRTANPVTPIYLLGAFDLTLNEEGEIAQVREEERVFNTVWLRTFWMGLMVTLLCLCLGYPLAYMLANMPTRYASMAMILVLIPFWTSALVRTTAWVVLLQNEGVVNDLGLALSLWSERVQLIHNRFGVYITMTHVLMPFVVLPLYAIMRRIPKSYMQAAKSMGANRVEAFWRVYFPLTRQGVGAGALFVYILAVGFYVTPQLVGGPNDQFISTFIAYFAGISLNWGPAAALATMLLIFKAALYYVMNVAFGISKWKVGA